MLPIRITLVIVVLIAVDYAVYRIRQRRHYARLLASLGGSRAQCQLLNSIFRP